ncbi:MAG: hypothetical protein H6833_04670 [Planctomycetes bacterium]|nr:hypothetical protein [Planctomycetota bacterium]
MHRTVSNGWRRALEWRRPKTWVLAGFTAAVVGHASAQPVPDLLHRWPAFPQSYPVPAFLDQAPHHSIIAAQPASLLLWGRELTFLYYCGNRANGHQATRMRFGEAVHDVLWMGNRASKLQAQFRGAILPALATPADPDAVPSVHDLLARIAWQDEVKRSATRAARRFALIRTEQEFLRHLNAFFDRRYRDPDTQEATRPGGRLDRELITVLRHTRAPIEFLRWLHSPEGETIYPPPVRTRFMERLAGCAGHALDATGLASVDETRWNDLAFAAAVALFGESDATTLSTTDSPRIPMTFPIVTGDLAYGPPMSQAHLRAFVHDAFPMTEPAGMLLPLADEVHLLNDAFELTRGGILGAFFRLPLEKSQGMLRIDLGQPVEVDLAECLRISSHLTTFAVPKDSHGPVLELDVTHVVEDGSPYREISISLAPEGPLETLAIREFGVRYESK